MMRKMQLRGKLGAIIATIPLTTGLMAVPAWAIPSYSAKMNQPCSACHLGGFGPQLTPFGRQFKLTGYTMDAGGKVAVPVSAEVVSSFTRTAKAQDAAPADHYATNDNFTLDHASVFFGGGIGDHLGYLSQWTYDGVGRQFVWDMLEVRAADDVSLWGNDVIVGITASNMPGITDIWDTLSVWGFRHSTSDLAPTPAAGPVFGGQFNMLVLGTTAYAYWNSSLYTEAGVYFSPSNGFLRAVGMSTSMGPGVISGGAPYVRVAYQRSYSDQNWEIGGFGFFPSVDPNGGMGPVFIGKTDSYSDVGVDASYEFIGDSSNVYLINARYTHESQALDASKLIGNAANLNNSLNDFRLDASYYWRGQIGGTVQLFKTTGSTDTILYGDSRTFSPNSSGVMFEIDGTPWGIGNSPFDNRLSLRVGLQYTMYTEFDGAGHNYNGTGRNASDNNTFRIYTWLML